MPLLLQDEIDIEFLPPDEVGTARRLSTGSVSEAPRNPSPEYAAMLGLRGMEQPPALGAYLWDGDRVKFGASELEVIAVPGHSPGGLCYYSEADSLLLAGDVLFAGSVGRADLPGGDARALIEGIKNKLMCLPDGTKVIAGHGGMTTIGEERKYNPFLR